MQKNNNCIFIFVSDDNYKNYNKLREINIKI